MPISDEKPLERQARIAREPLVLQFTAPDRHPHLFPE